MKFDFRPIEIVYDLDEEIKKNVYSLYEKYQKSKTRSSLYELLKYIEKEKNCKYRKEFFDLKIDENQTVFDAYITMIELYQQDAEFFSKYEEYVTRGLLKGKFSIGQYISEDILFKDINGKPLLEHLLNNQEFKPYILLNVKTRTEVIDILKRTNQEKLIQFLDEDLLFTKYDENQSVMEYLIANDLYSPRFLDRIKHHPEIVSILEKNNRLRFIVYLSPEILMCKRNGKVILEELLERKIHLPISYVVNEEMAKILLKHDQEYEMSEIPYEIAFMDIEKSDKKLFEYLTGKGVICYSAIGGALQDEKHMKEIIDILEKNHKLFALQNLSEEELIKTYGRSETLLETLLRNKVAIPSIWITKKETLDILTAYNIYEPLGRCNEDILLQELPNGKKLYQELINRKIDIATQGINNFEIVDAILAQSKIEYISCIGTECLLSKFELNETYLDKILQFAKNYDKRILRYLRFEDATVNEHAKIIIAHVRYGFARNLRNLDKEDLLDNSSGTTLLEELLREDERITTDVLLDNELKSNIEIATILKLHGIKQQTLTYDEEYKPKLSEQYIESTINAYMQTKVTREQEHLLIELFNTLNDGQTDLSIVNMIVASYRNLFSIGNPYANEIGTLIQMKKDNPDFHIEFTEDGACYSSREHTIYLETLNPQTFHHELGHAYFDMIHQKYIPEGFEKLIDKLKSSLLLDIKLENYDRSYRSTQSTVLNNINTQLLPEKTLDEVEAIERYLSTFTDGLEQRLIDKGYNPTTVKRILSETYTAEEFFKQERRINCQELLDTILRIDYNDIQGIGDYFDGIYRGKYRDGEKFSVLSGRKLSGYGHGVAYYSQGIEYIFDEMIANYSSITKMAGANVAYKHLEKYFGHELAKTIASSYNQMSLQHKISQTYDQIGITERLR